MGQKQNAIHGSQAVTVLPAASIRVLVPIHERLHFRGQVEQVWRQPNIVLDLFHLDNLLLTSNELAHRMRE